MNEEFEFGEFVEVRNHDKQEWSELQYIATAAECSHPYLTTSLSSTSELLVKGYSVHIMGWKQIRKIQPEYYNSLTDIEQPETFEQRLDRFEAILNGAIAHINAQINSIKSQLK